MIQQKCSVNRGKGDRAEKTQQPQHAGQIGLQKADIIVIVGLKALLKQKGCGQHNGAAVGHNGTAALCQTGGDYIRTLCCAKGGKGRPAVVADTLGEVVGIQHTVHLQCFQTAAQAADQMGVTYTGQITQAYHGVGSSADAQKGELKPPIV